MRYLTEDGDPPDVSTEVDSNDSDDSSDSPPPDIDSSDSGFDDSTFSMDSGGSSDIGGDSSSSGDGEEDDDDLGIDDKVSAIMNSQLYQKFLTLIRTLLSEISYIKRNSDILISISPDIHNILVSLVKLESNIKIYLSDIFSNENYSKNLLFFNKCINFQKLLNDSFEDYINKGIKNI